MPLDEETVEAIYHDHAEALRRFVWRSTRDPAAVEDIVQETVMRAWRAAPEVTGSLRAYLYRTARSVAIDRARREGVRPHAAGGDSLLTVEDRTRQIDNLLSRVLVEEALSRLSADHRDVVLALHYHGYTVAQTAERLGVPAGTVKSRAHYALRALRAVFEEMGVEQ